MVFYRKVYAQKSYRFIEPAECCPYLSDRHCDLRKHNVCDSDNHHYKKNCCTSRYYDRCSNFVNEVRVIKPNRYFKTSYSCPYSLDGFCELRGVSVYEKNRTFYRHACSTTDYARKCPYYIGRISKIKCKTPKTIYGCCPYKEGDWCKVRKTKIKGRSGGFYDHACCKSNYVKSCPYFMEAECGND